MTPVPGARSGVEQVPRLQRELLVNTVNGQVFLSFPTSFILPHHAPGRMASSAGGHVVVQVREPRLGGHTARRGEHWLLTMELSPCFVSPLPAAPLRRAEDLTCLSWA